MPSLLSASRNSSKPPSDDRLPPSKPAVSFLRRTAGRSKWRSTSGIGGLDVGGYLFQSRVPGSMRVGSRRG